MTLKPPISVEPGSCACDAVTRSCLCLPDLPTMTKLEAGARAAKFALDAAIRTGDRTAVAHHRAELRKALAELGGVERPAPATTTPAPKRGNHDRATPTRLDDERTAAAKLRDYVSDRWRTEP